MSAIGLYSYLQILLVKHVYNVVINEKGWFSTCQDNERPMDSLRIDGYSLVGKQSLHAVHYLHPTKLLIGRMVGITKRATQITAAETHKHSRTASPPAFALQRIEYLVDRIRHSHSL